AERDQLHGTPAPSHAADADHASQQTIASQLFVQAGQHLLQSAGVRICDDEPDIGRNCSNVGNMIANSFELEKDRSHDPSPQRNFHLSHAFNGLTESCSMGKTRIPGDALREKHGLRYRELLEEFFRALMRIE